jgi:hypothetical protein
MQVKLDNEKIRRLEMQRVLHALQQGSDLAAVFSRYEHDLERLRTDNEQLRAQNDLLAKTQVGCESAEQPLIQDNLTGSMGCKSIDKTHGMFLYANGPDAGQP